LSVIFGTAGMEKKLKSWEMIRNVIWNIKNSRKVVTTKIFVQILSIRVG